MRCQVGLDLGRVGGIVRPTREGRHSPFRLGLVTKGIGTDPFVSDEDPEEPTNWAASSNQGLAYVPYLNSGTAAVVQTKADVAAGIGVAVTVTLDASPTAGNLLVACVATDGDTGPDTTPSGGGWAQVNSDVYSGNGTNWPNRMFYKTVTAGMSAAVTVLPTGGTPPVGRARLGLIELSGVDTLDTTGSANNTSSTTASVTPSAGVGAIAVSATFGRNGSAPALSPASGMTEWAEIHTTDKPFALNYRVIATTAGSYTVGSTGAAANSSMIAAVFTNTGNSVVWADAPYTIDGSDSTYDFASHQSINATADNTFWRGTLINDRRIYSARLHVAWASNTTRTLTLQGGDESDYSDATTVETYSYTPSGSFTPDTVEVAWTADAAYRYWQWNTSVINSARIHEVDLYAPNGGATDHGNLTGNEDDDHTQYELTTEGGQSKVQAHGNLGATETIDPTQGNVHTGTLNADCTITIDTAPTTRDGSTSASLIELWLSQDGTGGWTPTFATTGGSFDWEGGTTPDIPTGASVTFRIILERVPGSTNDWIGALVGGTSSGGVDPDGFPRPLMAQDPSDSKWYVVVDGDGTAVMVTG